MANRVVKCDGCGEYYPQQPDNALTCAHVDPVTHKPCLEGFSDSTQLFVFGEERQAENLDDDSLWDEELRPNRNPSTLTKLEGPYLPHWFSARTSDALDAELAGLEALYGDGPLE